MRQSFSYDCFLFYKKMEIDYGNHIVHMVVKQLIDKQVDSCGTLWFRVFMFSNRYLGC